MYRQNNELKWRQSLKQDGNDAALEQRTCCKKAAGEPAAYLCLESRSFSGWHLVVRVDIVILGFANKQRTDHEGDERDHDRIPQAVIDIALERHQCERGGG